MEERGALIGFIVGTPRSGTTWLAESLNRHPDLVVIGETAYWGRKFVAPSLNGAYDRTDLERIGRRQRDGCRSTSASRKLSGKDGIIAQILADAARGKRPATPKSVFDEICSAIALEEKKPFVLEKTPHHINWVERIDSVYSNAKYIVMLREPYSFMLSYKHQGDRKDESVRNNFKKVYHPFGVALIYRGYLRSIREMWVGREHRIHLVYYNEVLADPSNVLEQVQAFLDVPIQQIDMPAVNTSFPGGKRPELSPDDRFWMNFIAGSEARQFGFESEESGMAVRDLLKSLACLPSWGINAIGHMKHLTGKDLFAYLARWLR